MGGLKCMMSLKGNADSRDGKSASGDDTGNDRSRVITARIQALHALLSYLPMLGLSWLNTWARG